jgi:hypothetical protein
MRLLTEFDRVGRRFQTRAQAKPGRAEDGTGKRCRRLLEMAKTPDADRQAREYIDRVVEAHRKNGYGLRLSKKRYEQAVARVAEQFRSLVSQ